LRDKSESHVDTRNVSRMQGIVAFGSTEVLGEILDGNIGKGSCTCEAGTPRRSKERTKDDRIVPIFRSIKVIGN